MYLLLKNLALPPLNLLVVIALGLVLVTFGKQRLGRIMAWTGLVFLYLASTSQVGNRLMRHVESIPALTPTELKTVDAQAIVILSATVDPVMTEFGVEKAGRMSLARLRYGAFVHKETGLPVLISGGRLPGWPVNVSHVLVRELEDSFGVPARWMEDRSTDTFENASMSAAMLLEANVTRVVLVTDAFHMRRAVQAFHATELSVVPAPTAFTRPPSQLVSYLPTVRGLTNTYYASHELLGRIWYWFRLQ